MNTAHLDFSNRAPVWSILAVIADVQFTILGMYFIMSRRCPCYPYSAQAFDRFSVIAYVISVAREMVTYDLREGTLRVHGSAAVVTRGTPCQSQYRCTVLVSRGYRNR